MIDQEPVTVCKTRDDYYNIVPVTLDEIKTRIAGYPAPDDLMYDRDLNLPIKLKV